MKVLMVSIVKWPCSLPSTAESFNLDILLLGTAI